MKQTRCLSELSCLSEFTRLYPKYSSNFSIMSVPTWVYKNAAKFKTNTSVLSKFTYYACNKVFDICEKFYYSATLGF